MPFKKHFPGQLPHEEIFTVIHRHWFNILTHFVAIIIFTLVTLGFFFLAPVLTALFDITLNSAAVYFITTLVFLFLWIYGFFIWIDYYFDVWIITDERILNIEQKSLFMRVISEVDLGRVQDVTTKVEGFLPTLLDFGDIFIQTAGQDKHFHFRKIGNPDLHKDEIVRLVKKIHEKRSGAVPASAI